MQTIKAFKEAEAHQGPSIIIAYSPCIEHGIKGGLINSIEMERMATGCGYHPIFRYNPDTTTFTLDSKDIDESRYDEFLSNEVRYRSLKLKNKECADELLQLNSSTFLLII